MFYRDLSNDIEKKFIGIINNRTIKKLKNYFIQWKVNKNFVFILLQIDIFLYIYIIYFIFIKEFIIDYK